MLRPSTYLKTAAHDEQGFTFVEIMVSLAILSIVVIAITSLITTNSLMGARAADKSRITDAMSELADRLRAMPYKDAGTVKTYVSSDGVVMNLTVSTSKENDANVKVITINGHSTKMQPQNKQKLEIILRNPSPGTDDSGGGGESPIVTNPPVINYLRVFRGYTELSSGGLLYDTLTEGTPKVSLSVDAPNPDATITSLRLFCNGELLKEQLNPLRNSEYSVEFKSNAVDASGNRLYKEGIGKITAEVKDDQGGFTKEDFPIVIDNTPVTNTFGANAVAVSTTNGIVVSWNPIPDPANGQNFAMRYKVVLDVYQGNTFKGEYEQIVTGTTQGALPPTSAVFANGIASGNKHYVYIYAMCPAGCAHAASEQVSKSYLYKAF